MKFITELNIPPHFFDSASAENAFESVSERIAKMFLKDILNIDNIRRGNDKIKEPDYIGEECGTEKGFEVTFAVNNSLIPQLKGRKALDKEKHNIEDMLISDISDALDRKSKKEYVCETNLVVLTVSSLIGWYYFLFDNIDAFPGKLANRMLTKRRNVFFEEIYTNYIKTGHFKNVYIVHPTLDSRFILFDIRSFAERLDFAACIETDIPERFPTYKVTNVEKTDGPICSEITIINYQE